MQRKLQRREEDMWRKPDRSNGSFPDERPPAEPLVCLLYEDEVDRQEMLSSIEKAGLGELPRVMIAIDSQPAKRVAAMAGARWRLPMRVA